MKQKIENTKRLLQDLQSLTFFGYSNEWSAKKLKHLRELMRDPSFPTILEEVEQQEILYLIKYLVPQLKEKLHTFFNIFPEINKFVIRGYTPRFMDGDKCEHLTSVELSSSKKEHNFISEVRDNSAEHWIYDNMEILQLIYGTDWEFTAIKSDDGQIGFIKGAYDCGY